MERRQRISSGSVWEERVGFSRALRVGDWVFVSGTTATDADDWEAVGRAHARFFADVRPANTLVEVSRLVGSGYLVEIDADALIADAR
ncbi:MAG: Rid family hydrolase [Chloroflexota bacterium]|nr:Rid family hydrolase [Chloroflexota bacterium]